ncbi:MULTISPECIES: response regulator transcription factor [unclassified Sphingobacterium]|uniref:response regulator transcription factor n=1 Tax=unclassified Sphingobacterium TaxID=2609468 RepID=UPI0025F5416D|nr:MULTISPECIES: response regulator transcription factor [unclassified Sphingobacterium]
MQRYGHILLIEDDLDLAAMLFDYLSGCGFDVVHAVSAERGIACYRTDKFDILIVDIQLPKWDGFQFVEYVSKLNKNQFVLFLTARLSKTDKLRGLHLGGNDYITKPFDVEELALKLQNYMVKHNLITQRSMNVGDIKLNDQLYTIEFGDKSKQVVSPREFELWTFLANKPNMVLRREEILMALWGENDYFLGRSLDVFICKIRKMLKRSRYVAIKTVYKVGFILEVNNENCH